MHALAADLSHLPCDILLSEGWMRSHAGSITFDAEGAESLVFSKGNKHYTLKPMQNQACHINTIQLNAIQMQRQLKPGKAVKCFAVKVTGPPKDPEPDAKATAPDPDLVSSAVMEAIKVEFQDVFQPPPDGLPPDRGTGHLIPLRADHKPPYRNPYRLSPLEIAEVKR